MNRVTGYKCIFESKAEIWRFALTLKGEPAEAGFAVSNPETAETLLDMFDDANGCHFDPMTGEMAFGFDYVAGDDDQDNEESPEATEDTETSEEEAGENTETEANKAA